MFTLNVLVNKEKDSDRQKTDASTNKSLVNTKCQQRNTEKKYSKNPTQIAGKLKSKLKGDRNLKSINLQSDQKQSKPKLFLASTSYSILICFTV